MSAVVEGQRLSPGALAEVLHALVAAGVEYGGDSDVYVLGSEPALDRCVHRLATELVPFGMQVVRVPREHPDVVVVSGHGPGLPAAWSDGNLDGFVAEVRSDRMRRWANLTQPSPTLRTIHRPGSDSIGVVEFETTTQRLVAKTGPTGVMGVEEAHVRRADATGSQIFPNPRGYEIGDALATRIMDAADDARFADRLFARSSDGLLRARPEAMSLLDGHLAALSTWYASTLRVGEPAVGRYLYVDRFRLLPSGAQCRQVGESVLGSREFHDAFERRVILDDDEPDTLAGFVEWLDASYPQWAPTYSAAIHGDIFTSNLMYGPNGDPRFIDPRTAWDGVAEAPDGLGDPIFDFGTLLHAVSPMVAVLDACRRGEDALLTPSPVSATGPVDLRASLITEADPARAVYVAKVAALTASRADRGAEVRLHVASACSLLGWLKYAKVVQTPDTWWALLGAVLADLKRAKRAHERNHHRGRGIDV